MARSISQSLLCISCFAYLILLNNGEIVKYRSTRDDSSQFSDLFITKQDRNIHSIRGSNHNRSYNLNLQSTNAISRKLQAGSVVRINCGSNADWTDPTTGYKWIADKYHDSGSGYSNCPLSIDNTDSDNLFCSHHSFYGPNTKGTYNIPVVPGVYTVKVMFAEIFFGGPQARVFQIIVQDKTLDAALDVYAKVGKNKAFVLQTTVDTQNTGVIKVSLVNVAADCMISAIEVVPAGGIVPGPAPALATAPTAVRINCGSNSDWTDPTTGYKWIADKYYDGGSGYSNCPISIDDTDSDNLFCSHHNFYGPNAKGTYNIPVAPGAYSVKVMFAEIYFGGPQARVFQIIVQDKTLDATLDVYAKVGKNKAFTLQTTVDTQNTGVIKVSIANVAGDSMISAIEIVPVDGTVPVAAPTMVTVPTPTAVGPAVRINCGSNSDWTDPTTGYKWIADKYYDGGSGYSNCPISIDDTDSDNLFCSHHNFYGPNAKGTYNIPVVPGVYTVKVMFAEIYFDGPQSRTFQVIVQDKTLNAALDVYAKVGKNKAFVLQTTVDAQNMGFIKISLTNGAGDSMISAIEIVPASDTVPVTAPTLATAPTPIAVGPAIRINCGAVTAWTDPSTGLTWAADAYSDGGGTYSGCPIDIAKTDQDNLYCSHHSFWGGPNTVGSYTVPVQPGQYTVNLLFAEVYFGDPNKRAFKVSVQGKVLQASVDVTELVGAKTAYVLTTPVTVGAGTTAIRIELTNLIENSMISGIEIIPSSTLPGPVLPTPVLPSIRINCGAAMPWTDPATGLTWGADNYSDGGGTFNGCPATITGTDKSALYCDNRSFYGAGGSYNIPVQPGQYTVHLLFAEVFFWEPNKRAFKVLVQGKVLQASLDLIVAAGTKTAYSLTTTINVDPGNPTIKIEFTTVVENPIISAIEIIPTSGTSTIPAPAPAATGSSTAIRINCGAKGPWTDPSTGYTWTGDAFSDGGGEFSLCPTDIAKTDQDNLFCSHHSFYGGPNTVGSYTIPVQPGSYTVNLLFAEIFFGDPNKRSFKVSVQGKVVQPSVDVTALVGAKTAYVLTTPVTVAVGTTAMKIELTNLVENSMISGIEIIPTTSTGIIPAPGPGPVTNLTPQIRINVGSTVDWTDPATGLVWSADKYFTANGFPFSLCPYDVDGTTQDPLYCVDRVFFGPNGYTIPVLPGQYTVKLMFTELFFGTAGSRVFDVLVQGKVIKAGFDILATAGGKGKAYDITTVVTVDATTNNNIKIDLINKVENPKINAIVISPEFKKIYYRSTSCSVFLHVCTVWD